MMPVMKSDRVLVAMSGGVDSSAAAAWCQQAGYEVTGLYLRLKSATQPGELVGDQANSQVGSQAGGQVGNQTGNQSVGQVDKPPARRVDGQAAKQIDKQTDDQPPDDARDARQVAERLGIAFEVLDLQQDLETIVEYFVAEYRRGRTPNPCIRCNSRVKFARCLQFARARGIDYIATGHYAQIRQSQRGPRLCRGIDFDKDQSYALFGIGHETLQHVLLPNGQYTKGQIRQFARRLDLPVHDKAESQEICFVPDDDYARFIAQRAPELCRPGRVINRQGERLGEHTGVYQYTIGQRRGLRIALGEPAYVIELDAATNTVVLGSRQELLQTRLKAGGVCWLIEPDSIPREPFEAVIQIRYNHRGAPGIVRPAAPAAGSTDAVEVEFTEPVAAITPGQAAVFYQDDTLLGGGWIDSAG